MSNRITSSKDVQIAIEVFGRYGDLDYRDAVRRVAEDTSYAVKTVYDMANRAKSDPRTIGGVAVFNALQGYDFSFTAGLYEVSVDEVKSCIEAYRRDVKRHNHENEALNHIVPPGHHVKGVSKLLDDAGNVKLQWIKTDATKEGWIELLQSIIETIPQRIKPIELISLKHHTTADKLAFYPLADLHLGLYATALDGGGDWNLEKALRVYREAFADLIDRTPATEEAILANLGDFNHADNGTNRTPKSGAILDVDGRFFEAANAAAELSVELINRAAQKHDRVKVKWMRGNHDKDTSVVIGAMLKQIYLNNERVTISPTAAYFQVEQFHNVAVGVTHGDTVKMSELPLIMATQFPKIWSDTTYRVFHTGHIHHRVVEEFNGCDVEAHRSPTVRDQWHEEQGYRSKRSISSIIYDFDGEYARNTINL